jgi:hypothetical protein
MVTAIAKVAGIRVARSRTCTPQTSTPWMPVVPLRNAQILARHA